jgi:hypothetical protein
MVWLTRWFRSTRPPRGLVWALCAFVAAATLACERSPEQRTSLFREAETHFERGEYERALDDYQAFIEQHPRHRLADTARLRIESVNREVQSVMGRDDMQTPRHVVEESDSPADEPGSVPSADARDGA